MDNVAPELKEAFTKYIEIQGNREAERELSKTHQGTGCTV